MKKATTTASTRSAYSTNNQGFSQPTPQNQYYTMSYTTNNNNNTNYAASTTSGSSSLHHRYSPSKIQKPKKTSPNSNKFLSPKTLAAMNLIHNGDSSNSKKQAVPTYSQQKANVSNLQQRQTQQQQHYYKQPYKGGMVLNPNVNSNISYQFSNSQLANNTRQPSIQNNHQHRYPLSQASQQYNASQQHPTQQHYLNNGNTNTTTKSARQFSIGTTATTSMGVKSHSESNLFQSKTLEQGNRNYGQSAYNTSAAQNPQHHHMHYHHHFPAGGNNNSTGGGVVNTDRRVYHQVLNPSVVSKECITMNSVHQILTGTTNSSSYNQQYSNNNANSKMFTPSNINTTMSQAQPTMVLPKSVNSSISSISTSSTSVSALSSTRSSFSSNSSSLSIGSNSDGSDQEYNDRLYQNMAIPKNVGTDPRAQSWNQFTNSQTQQQYHTNTNLSNNNTNSNNQSSQRAPQGEKKSEPLQERRPSKSMEPSMVEDDDSSKKSSTVSDLSKNRSLGWMWSPTKIQRAQERTKRQILSVLLSPSSSEDEEDEEIFAKIQQRYNEATLRINSIINSSMPDSSLPQSNCTTSRLVNNTHSQPISIQKTNDSAQQTEESFFQHRREPTMALPKKAPQLSGSFEAESIAGQVVNKKSTPTRPLTFKSQNLTSSLQQQKDRMDEFYLPPIVFPPSLKEPSVEKNQNTQKNLPSIFSEENSLSYPSSLESDYYTPRDNSPQPINNNRYGVVDTMIHNLLDEDDKKGGDDDMVLYDDDDDCEESPTYSSHNSSFGLGDCSLSSMGSYGSPYSFCHTKNLSMSPEGSLSSSNQMKEMIARENFHSQNPPKDRIKLHEFSVEVKSFRQQTRQLPIISLASHCINQIFLDGSQSTTLFLERMMSILCDRADIDHRCVLSALFFMVKLQNPSFLSDENHYSLFRNEAQGKSLFGNIETCNFIYTFCVCLMISSKINEDNYYNNKTFFKYMAVNEFKQLFHTYSMDNAFDYMCDMSLLMVQEDGTVPCQQTLSCSERIPSQTLINERYKKYFQQFNIAEVNITKTLNYDVCVKEASLCNFLDKLERVNESLLVC